MKKLLLVLVILAIAMTQLVGFAEETAERQVLTVGVQMRPSGNFYTGLWGNNTTDIDIRTLIHGYTLVYNRTQVAFQIDANVVSSLEYADRDNGNRVYTISLWEDLTYNDGTPITADDYIFTVLLSASKEAAEIGGQTSALNYIEGFEAYAAGETDVLTGVKKLGDYTFSIEVTAENLPYFYEYAYLSFQPSPIGVIAPECAISATDEGCAIVNADPEVEERIFTAELLTETLFGENGYMSHPQVTCGPYQLISYDEETGEVDVEINPNYKGNYETQKPTIDELHVVYATETDMAEKLESGELDLMIKALTAEGITSVMAYDDINASSYARDGYCFISFACEQGPTQFESVRKAVSYCLDQDAFVEASTGDYGIAVYGYYGIGQWMTQAAMGAAYPGVDEGEDAETTEETEETAGKTEEEIIAMWSNVTLDGLTHYEYDTELAKQTLIADGWTLNAEGEEYDETTDAYRCKEVDGELMPLIIKWAKTEDSAVSDTLEELLIPELEKVGMQVEITEMTFEEMLTYYYREGERTYDMFELGTNFQSAFDPYPTYCGEEEYQGSANTTGFSNEELTAIAEDMRRTTYGDMITYCEKWVEFQNLYTELLPTIPLYSNTYYDFYTEDLTGYAPSMYESWASAILYASLGEAEEETFDDINWDELGM